MGTLGTNGLTSSPTLIWSPLIVTLFNFNSGELFLFHKLVNYPRPKIFQYYPENLKIGTKSVEHI